MSVRKTTILLLVIGAFMSCSCDTIKRSEILDVNGRYSVEWEVDLETEIIVFSLDVETTGYVGFGISMNPSMAGADIVIGGVNDDETTYFADYHATRNTSPQLDVSQDWQLLSATESNGHTLLRFSRKLNTCDVVGDVVITADTQYLIWAIGDTDDITYHGADANKRSAKIINLLDASRPTVDLTQYDVYQIRRNHELLPVDTSYWCTIHKAPNFDGIKHHIIAINTTLTTHQSIKHTHHLALYNCEPPAGQTTEYFEQYVGHPGKECFEKNAVIPALYCTSMLYVWAIGGDILVLPEMTGYPIGDSGRQEYFMLEVHVDNPELETGNYETGIDLFYTSKVREIDAGILDIGHPTSYLQIIPPGSDDFVNIGQCSSDCTKAHIPEEGITLFNVMFHAHKAGKKMRTRIIRDDIELPWLAVDNHYDFNYQANKPYQEYRKVLPGDHIITECTYDTSTRPNVTIGGRSSMSEMCYAFFWIYPKGFHSCESSPNLDLNELFGIESYDAPEYGRDPTLTKPDAIAGLKFSEHLNTLTWTDDLKSRLQHELIYGPHRTICTGTNRPVSYPEIRQVYAEEDVCNNVANYVQTLSYSAFLILLLTILKNIF